MPLPKLEGEWIWTEHSISYESPEPFQFVQNIVHYNIRFTFVESPGYIIKHRP